MLRKEIDTRFLQVIRRVLALLDYTTPGQEEDDEKGMID